MTTQSQQALDKKRRIIAEICEKHPDFVVYTGIILFILYLVTSMWTSGPGGSFDFDEDDEAINADKI